MNSDNNDERRLNIRDSNVGERDLAHRRRHTKREIERPGTTLNERSHNVLESQSTARNFQEADPTDLIRARADELYEERLKEEGHAEEDWLRAEAEISARRVAPTTAKTALGGC